MRLSNLIQMMYITMLWMKRWLPGSHFRSRTGRKGTITMTENEAIERIKEHMEIHKLNEPRAFYITEAFDIAITALKEIQQYREIGTVEEFRKLKERSSDNE